MKYSKRRKINTLLGLIPLIVLMLSIVGGVTYAIVNGTRTSTEHGFQVNVRGAVKVDATITGASYFNGSSNEDTVELKVQGGTTTIVDDKTNFIKGFEFDQNGDKAEIIFEIKNETQETKYTDLIIKPSYTLKEANNVISTMYYSVDGTNYNVLTDTYLVAHKNDNNDETNETVYIKLVIEITEINEVYTDPNGKINFELSTEDALPTDFEYDKTYSVDGNKAYVTEKCPTCGDKHKDAVAMEEGTYVIATPDNAQEVLDSDINGKVIIFNGIFNNALEIRPSKSTANIYTHNSSSTATQEEKYQLGSEVTGELVDGYPYHYTREVKDVKFVATDTAIFNNLIYSESVQKAINTGSLAGSKYDAVKQKEISSTSPVIAGFFPHVKWNNISFENLNFKGENGRIVFYIFNPNDDAFEGAENIVIKGCSFETTTASNIKLNGSGYSAAAIAFDTHQKSNVFKNIIITDCFIDGHYMGVVTNNVSNLTLTNNIVKNSGFNAFAVQSTDAAKNMPSAYLTGSINIYDNTIINTEDRAIRIGVVKNAKIKVVGNSFEYSVDGNELLKTNATIDSIFEFINNTYANTELQAYKNVADIVNILVTID